VDIEYDTEKDVANRTKHGVPLALGAVALANRIGELPDKRFDYGEVRVNAFGLVEEQMPSAPTRYAVTTAD
jgi:uncharacterized DUF497 family protein